MRDYTDVAHNNYTHWHPSVGGGARSVSMHAEAPWLTDDGPDVYPNDHRPAVAYLGGPMRGIPFWNFPAFEEAADELRELGWKIHSPAEHDLSLGLVPVEDGSVAFPVSACLDWDFARIAESSCIIVLPGWEKSTGCHWEFTVAYALGKPVFQYPELTQVELPKVVTHPLKFSAWNLFPEVETTITLAEYGDVVITPPSIAQYAREHAGGTRVERPDAFDKALDALGAYARVTDDRSGAGTTHIVDTTKTRTRVNSNVVTKKDGGEKVVGIAAGAGQGGEIRVVDPQTGGAKGQKSARTDLLPPDALMALAEHYGRGSLKYADRNWEKSYPWSLSIAALKRHLFLWEQGLDTDHDAQVGDFPHIVAVAWHALALLTFTLREIGTDDRHKLVRAMSDDIVRERGTDDRPE